AVVLFYFAGKEAGGIWVGLVAEAAAAFSKPLLIENLIGMTAVTVPLAVALLLWTTFRLFNRTSWGRFIQWGLALGFAPYNYTPIRTWLPFIITVVLAWLFFHKLKGRPKSWVEILLGCGTLTVWILGFLKVNNFLPESDLNLGAAAKGAVVMLLAALAVVQWRGHQRESDRNWVSAFFLSVLLATALMYPLASDPEISVHTSGLSIFHNQETRTFHYENSVLDQMLKKTGNTLETMFVGGQDRGDLNLPWDAFFEYHFLPLLLLGLAAFLSRPGWLSLFLVLGGFVGISTHILSIDPHSAKMVAAVAPLAILCGLGIRQLAASLSARSRKVSLGISFAVLAYLGWAVWGTYDRVWGHYFKIGGVDKIVSQAVGDLADRYRLYMGVYRDFASPESQSLLDEGHNVYLLQPYNPIFLRPGEAPR
ncbi:MAG TPA: hypothetical protein VFR02_09460, partial [bacterium]|nr:hypothetical protein [bacterium]